MNDYEQSITGLYKQPSLGLVRVSFYIWYLLFIIHIWYLLSTVQFSVWVLHAFATCKTKNQWFQDYCILIEKIGIYFFKKTPHFLSMQLFFSMPSFAFFCFSFQFCMHSNVCVISFLIFIVFFHCHLVPLYNLPQSPHCCPSSLVLFPFCSIPPSPHLPTIAVILLSIYESLSIFFVSSVCSSDSTYKWNHMAFVFLWKAHFTLHNVLQVNPYCHIYPRWTLW